MSSDIVIESETGLIDVTSVDQSTMVVGQAPIIIDIISSGPPGPRGNPGPPGSAGGVVIIDIPAPQSTWVIDVGEIADIMVIDSAGTVVEPGEIKYEGTKVTLTFSAPFSGQAYCFI